MEGGFRGLVGSGLVDFILVSVVLGGGAAFLTGQTIAREWGKERTVVIFALFIALATRFLHYSMFEGIFLAPLGYLIDAVLFTLIGIASYRMMRATRMVMQYPWLYRRDGLFSWRDIR
jgi:hypothetical protein